MKSGGKRMAATLDLKVCGSVGLLIKAKQIGEIAAVKPLLDEMKKQGIYYGGRFIDAVLRTVNE